MSCIIGSWGWKHPEWEKDVFYPDDLPLDWRLSYYSNEFDMAVVPAEYWTKEGYGDEDWIDDVTESFVFFVDWPFLQMSSQSEYRRCADYCQSLEQQMAAILINDEVWGKLSNEQQQWFEQVTKDFKILRYNVSTQSSIHSAFSLAYDDRKQTEGQQLLLLRSDSKENLRDLGGRLSHLIKSSDQAMDENSEEGNSGTKIEYIALSNETVEIQRLKELKTLITLLVD